MRTAAQPKRIAKGEAETGVPVRGELVMDTGVIGPVEVLSESRPFVLALRAGPRGLFTLINICNTTRKQIRLPLMWRLLRMALWER